MVDYIFRGESSYYFQFPGKGEGLFRRIRQLPGGKGFWGEIIENSSKRVKIFTSGVYAGRIVMKGLKNNYGG